MKISIIDTGSANLNSVVQAFKRIGYEAIVSSEISELQNADRLVLPGVGTAAAVMDGINKYKLRDFILETQKPLLGICLGMQIQATDSEEVPLGQDSVIECLDIVKARCVKLKCDGLRLPHMGWNTVNHTDHPLFSDIKQDTCLISILMISYAGCLSCRYMMNAQRMTIAEAILTPVSPAEGPGSDVCIIPASFGLSRRSFMSRRK